MVYRSSAATAEGPERSHGNLPDLGIPDDQAGIWAVSKRCGRAEGSEKICARSSETERGGGREEVQSEAVLRVTAPIEEALKAEQGLR